MFGCCIPSAPGLTILYNVQIACLNFFVVLLIGTMEELLAAISGGRGGRGGRGRKKGGKRGVKQELAIPLGQSKTSVLNHIMQLLIKSMV